MPNDKEWVRPKKPYTVTPNAASKPINKPKPVIVAAKNNENNKVLHESLREGKIVKVTINNLLSSDRELSATYEGKILRFDDFTILLETFNGQFLINKSAIAVIAFTKNAE